MQIMALAVSAMFMTITGIAPHQNLFGANSGYVSAPAGALAHSAGSVTNNLLEAMPQNPATALPKAVSPAIPDTATVVSQNLAVTGNGVVQDLQTGKTVSDPQIVGTPAKPSDPLAKTNGASFVPVSAGAVKAAVGVKNAQTQASGGANPAAFAGSGQSAVYSPAARLETAAFGNGNYGAYWGTMQGSPAFFQQNNAVFVQQATKVIDVSAWQGNIDWASAKADGVQGAIIRLSFGWGNGLDSQAQRNINECKRLGIPFGVYIYSYAYDATTGGLEGADVAQLLRNAGVSPGDLKYPVFYDLERWTWTGHAPPTTPSAYEGVVGAWYAKLQAAGYNNLSVYSYTSYLDTALNSGMIRSRTRWVAEYGPTMNFTGFSSNDRGWQYTSSGSVNGIVGNVDLNAFGNRNYVAAYDVTRLGAVSIPNGEYYINALDKDSSSLDITGASTVNGARTQLYHYNKSVAQRFTFTRQPDGSYVITNVGSGKALDVAAGIAGNNAVVQQYTSNGTAAQRWFIRNSGGGYYLQSALGNWVLDLHGGLTADGSVIGLYEANASNAQRFVLASVSAAIPMNSAVKITSVANPNLVMDVTGGLVDNGTPIELYPWNKSDAQLYRFTEVGNGVYQITSVISNKAIEIAGGSKLDGGRIQQYSVNGTVAQHWSVLDNGGGRYSLVNGGSGKSIDIPSGLASQSAKLQSYASNGSVAQQWAFSAQPTVREQLNALAASHRNDLRDGVYSLGASTKSYMKLDVAGGSSADMAAVRLWASNGTGAQRWRVSHDGNGYVTLTNAKSGKVLDVAGASTANGARVQQYSSNGSWAQKWIAVKNQDGSLTFYSAIIQNRVLDVAGGSTANGANIQLYSSNGSGAQKWEMG